MARRVRLVLSDSDGRIEGRLPEFGVQSPHWSETGPVIAAARREFGIAVTILRLLSAVRAENEDRVTYLALADRFDAALPFSGAERPDPRRARWASADGLLAILNWADATLRGLGRPRTGPGEQIKTWNLSSVWKLPTARGPVWCKSVANVLGDEGAALRAVAGPAWIPRPLAHSETLRTVLLEHVPGEDQWSAPLPRLVEMVERLVDLQATWATRIPVLAQVGADWRGPAFTSRAAALVDRLDVRGLLTAPENAAVAGLVAGLPRRFAALGECGLPDSLVRGDFHPGNWRGRAESLTLLDWAEVGVGHPLLDLENFLPWVPAPQRSQVRDAASRRWRAHVPSADPERAAALVRPLAGLQRAIFFRQVLDGIEPSEHPYHEDDVPAGLRAAIARL